MRTSLLLFFLAMTSVALAQNSQMLFRVSEIEIHPQFLASYKAILLEEAEASVRLEPGVVAILPMLQKEDSTQVRILEIYASDEAYKSHLTTPHFQYYKSATRHMVKALRLVDMSVIDKSILPAIFKKYNPLNKCNIP